MFSDNTWGLCEYHTSGFTDGELEALKEYDERCTLKGRFDLEELLHETGLEADEALRLRAGELARWHDDLLRLMADPRIENERRRENAFGPPYDDHGTGPYGGAVARFLAFSAEDYHRHRRGYEHAVTVWALGLQALDSYPPDTCGLDLDNRVLKLWG
ncbi:hypothetical protein GCM10010387_22260 [Streptomyces inusitatus]|uniref:Uncharacterized protein n=1 Tax=Streptomyces inusitatus TaxID=68221 RepID=A0A918PZP9_9ACTN|nr:hypothetical protein [Streptomyces inusitatus]GGZ28363.1 hypothetical protein GCM10010387_22260 [Streptomyces inusitatus]